MMSLAVSRSIISLLISTTSPTCPISIISGALTSGPPRSINIFFALINVASLPVRPTALPPLPLIRLTISWLTAPPRTIWTTSIVLLSVTRIPSTKLDSIPSSSSRLPICGPPPWTTTGFIPTSFMRTTSLANPNFSSSSVIALPPYLITMVLPVNL